MNTPFTSASIKFTHIQGFPVQYRFPLQIPDVTTNNLDQWFNPVFNRDKLIDAFYRATPREPVKVTIPDSWREDRLHFQFQVFEKVGMGVTMIHYLMGYTECWDGVYAGWKQSKLFLNRCLSYRVNKQYTADGVVESLDLIKDISISAPQSFLETRYIVRPQDVFAQLEPFFGARMMESDGPILDMRSIVKHANNTAFESGTNDVNSWVNKVVDSYWDALTQLDIDDSPDQVWRDSMFHTRVESLRGHPFLSILRAHTDLDDAGYVTLDQLTKIFDNAVEVNFNYPVLDDLVEAEDHTSMLALIARRIIDCMSVKMAKFGARELVLFAHRGEVSPVSMEGFHGQVSHPDELMTAMECEILQILRAVTGRCGAQVRASVNLESIATVSVCINPDDPEAHTYTVNYPMFASSSLSQLYVDSQEQLVNLARDVKSILEQLTRENHRPMKLEGF